VQKGSVVHRPPHHPTLTLRELSWWSWYLFSPIRNYPSVKRATMPRSSWKYESSDFSWYHCFLNPVISAFPRLCFTLCNEPTILSKTCSDVRECGGHVSPENFSFVSIFSYTLLWLYQLEWAWTNGRSLFSCARHDTLPNGVRPYKCIP